MESRLRRATDASMQFEADGSFSSFNGAAEHQFDVADIEDLHQPASHLSDMRERFHDNVPGFLLDDVRRPPDKPAAEPDEHRQCLGRIHSCSTRPLAGIGIRKTPADPS